MNFPHLSRSPILIKALSSIRALNGKTIAVFDPDRHAFTISVLEQNPKGEAEGFYTVKIWDLVMPGINAPKEPGAKYPPPDEFALYLSKEQLDSALPSEDGQPQETLLLDLREQKGLPVY